MMKQVIIIGVTLIIIVAVKFYLWYQKVQEDAVFLPLNVFKEKHPYIYDIMMNEKK